MPFPFSCTSGRRRLLHAALAASAALFVGGPASASDAGFPNKPITLVVPFAAGGSLDATARILADHMKDTLGQQVLVANRPGAGSSVGARAVAGAAPDGHTLFFTSGSAYGFLHLLMKGFTLQLQDFAPIASVAINSSLIAVGQAVPANNLRELVALAQGRPGGISFCTTGIGGLNHLQLEMLRSEAKAGGKSLEVTHVPYNGVAPALTALRAGDVQACTLPYSALVKNLHGKELRVLAVQRSRPLASMPDIATTGASGFPGLDGNDQYVNLSAPKGTPPTVLQKIEAAVRKAMQDPAVVKRMEEIDVQPTYLGMAETQKWLEDNIRTFGSVIREAGLVNLQ